MEEGKVEFILVRNNCAIGGVIIAMVDLVDVERIIQMEEYTSKISSNLKP